MGIDTLIFSGWTGLFRTAILAVLGYLTVQLVLRTASKRTLSKMNMADFVVTIAFGSILASMILLTDVAFTQGLVALVTLIVAEYAFTWALARSGRLRRLVVSKPTILYYGGEFLTERMRRERVTRDEILFAVRMNGAASLDDILAVILETDSSLSVLRHSQNEGREPLDPLDMPDLDRDEDDDARSGEDQAGEDGSGAAGSDATQQGTDAG